MPMLAEVVDAVIGVDTHRDTHTLRMLNPTGLGIADQVIGNDTGGYRTAIDWAIGCSPGPRLVFAVEGTRSYGIGLTRALLAAGLPVVEIAPPGRGRRRGTGKTDHIDAGMAALAALRLDTDRLAIPRGDGDREAMRILLGARDELATTRTRQVNRLRALLLTGDDTDRHAARATLTNARLQALARKRANRGASTDERIRHAEIRRLAAAIRRADRDLAANATQLTNLVKATAPDLLQRPGVGPVSAAQAIVSFSHPGRCRSDAAYAALAGTCPIPASSGQTTRWRLNRGGDRALNRALHTIAHSRMTHCPRTQTYVTKRRAQGLSTAEIRRCLKRYITRELFRLLTTAMT